MMPVRESLVPASLCFSITVSRSARRERTRASWSACRFATMVSAGGCLPGCSSSRVFCENSASVPKALPPSERARSATSSTTSLRASYWPRLHRPLLLLGDHAVLDLVVGGLRHDLLLHQLVLALVGPALDDLLGIGVADTRDHLEIVLAGGVEIQGLVPHGLPLALRRRRRGLGGLGPDRGCAESAKREQGHDEQRDQSLHEVPSS